MDDAARLASEVTIVVEDRGDQHCSRWEVNHAQTEANIADAIRCAVAAERAAWVATCWNAYNDGYSDQGWTVLHEMKATDEVPK